MAYNTLIKPTIIITVIAFISAFTLSHVEKITTPAIQARKADKQKAALAVVLHGFTVGDEIIATASGAPFHYWVGEKKNADDDGTVSLAYAFITASPGYSGNVESMVGVDDTGKILGIYIIEQKETPGLGARCMEVVSRYTIWDLPEIFSGKSKTEAVPWFQQQFTGRQANDKIHIVKLGDWTAEKEQQLLEHNAITAITGATITGRAVINSINSGYAALREILSAASEENTAGNERGDGI
jgi:electron transport complex protein RnfG